MTNNPPLDRTAAAVYFTRGRASRVRRRGRSTALRYSSPADVMLVLSRIREESIVVSDAGGGCVLTVLHVRGGEVALLVNHSSVEKPGVLDTWTTTLVRDASFKIGKVAEVTLVDVRE